MPGGCHFVDIVVIVITDRNTEQEIKTVTQKILMDSKTDTALTAEIVDGDLYISENDECGDMIIADPNQQKELLMFLLRVIPLDDVIKCVKRSGYVG